MPRDYKQFFAICKRHGWDYRDKVAELTQGRTDSLKALTDGEYHELLTRAQRFNTPPVGQWKPKPGNAQRRKMIAIARDMRWDAQSNEAMMQRLDNWCLTQTKYKKKLNQLSEDELNKVLYVFEYEVKKDFLKSI